MDIGATITAVAGAWGKTMSFLSDLNDPGKRALRLRQADMKRYKIAIDAAEAYILLTFDLDLATTEKEKDRLTRQRDKAQARFFRYNQ